MAGVLCVLLGAAAIGGERPCSQSATEGWDGGAPNGWVGSAGSAVTVPTTGGNPGGYLLAGNPGLVGAQTSDPPWIGDWGATDVARITFDFIYETADLLSPHVRVRESGASNGWYYFVEPIGASDGRWHHYEVPVNPWWTDQEAMNAGWSDLGAPNPSFAATLAGVTIVQLAASAGTGADGLGIDNFTLLPCLFADGFEQDQANPPAAR